LAAKESIIDLRRKSRAEAVADVIEARISKQRLLSGHRLGTKESLRAEFDVAVASFNEAVRLLSARGVITVRPGVKGGIFVAPQTVFVRFGRKMLELTGESVSVADCLVVREALDPLVVRDATLHRSPKDVRDLRGIVEKMAVPDLPVAEYLRINWALHRRMAAITSNEILRHTYVSLLDFVESHVHGVTAADSMMDNGDGPRVHRELVEAIASEDLERANRATQAHTELTMPSQSTQ
jgi:DNA-binding FadR family transcriptional regulator